ncbi:MAG TPA: alpha/beta fold hydrolase [Gemmatimonadaceae bacterium]|nr:alpha/beta fold hydrolase [Gemmatimonadaceae bacterium]
MTLSRREFTAVLGTALLADLLGCGAAAPAPAESPERLIIPPTSPTHSTAPTGLRPLSLDRGRDGQLYVPQSYDPAVASALIILLHGAGQSSAEWFGSYGRRADALKEILLAPDSRGQTWDVANGGFGPDVAFINRALRSVFSRYNVDRRRITLAGFSDGASYSLSLGLANGDVVPNVIAFSPGFVVRTVRRGTPAFFISHGTSDQILNIDRASRPIVASLKRDGYSVEYREFDGRHEVPQAISDAAMEWLVKRQMVAG